MNTGLLGGLTFVLVFAGMILVHEIGHFVAARLLRIEVDEFGIGFPPRMLTLFTWRGVRFSLNWIPFGGFVRLRGEDDPAVPNGIAAAPPWKRILVLLAGSTMNLLTGVLAYSLLFNQIGLPDQVVLEEIVADSPAAMAGFQAGDIVLEMDGQRVGFYTELINYTHENAGQEINLTILRDGEELTLSVVPRLNPPEGQGPMGVVVVNTIRPVDTWFETFPYSFNATYQTSRELLALPGRIIAGIIQPEDARLLGPRSIYNVFQQAVSRDIESRQPEENGEAEAPTNYTLSLIISMTLSVGIINLLPIPALDGGRIFLALVEFAFRRRLPPQFEAIVHGAGFFLLVGLMFYFYILDFVNPVNITLP